MENYVAGWLSETDIARHLYLNRVQVIRHRIIVFLVATFIGREKEKDRGGGRGGKWRTMLVERWMWMRGMLVTRNHACNVREVGKTARVVVSSVRVNKTTVTVTTNGAAANEESGIDFNQTKQRLIIHRNTTRVPKRDD